MVKYVLVTSQYYYSYHQFICVLEENFIENTKGFIEEIELYKRDAENTKPIYYGDFNDKYEKRINRILNDGGRFNLNDSGDLYFELSNSIMHLHNEINEHDEHGERSKKYFKGKEKKEIEKKIAERHDNEVIKSLIEKYFKVA